MKTSAIACAFCIAVLTACPLLEAGDVHLRSPGPLGVGYVGLYYGLVDPGTGEWYVADSFYDPAATVRAAIADTGGSACILGKATQDAYVIGGAGIPMQSYPDVEFLDEGFGGQESFMVAAPLRLMIADFKAAEEAADPEDPALYTAYGPPPAPPTIEMAGALDPIGGGVFGIDFDIIGMSAMQNQLLYVDPHYRRSFRFFFQAMAGSLERPAPPGDHPRALYLPIALHDFFDGQPQTADVGDNPVLPVRIRKAASDPFATRATALFDTGAGSNYISETFAVEAGIDLGAEPDLTTTVSGIGSGQTERPGWYVDALALDLGRGREGDRLLISNTAVFVIPDADMPSGLDAILGNAIFSAGVADLLQTVPEDSSLLEWYVDMRDPDNTCIILVPAKPGDANFDDVVDGADYTAWADHYGQSGTWAEGDFSGDQQVDGGDYTAWADSYDGLAAGGAAAVPEPSVATLLLPAASVLLRRRERRRSLIRTASRSRR